MDLSEFRSGLDRWLDDVAAGGVAPARTVLVGFSQGTMMALHVGLRRREPLAGIVGFSGRLLEPQRLPAEVGTAPPVLLVHGERDRLVPVAAARAAAAENPAWTVHIVPDLGHAPMLEKPELVADLVGDWLTTHDTGR